MLPRTVASFYGTAVPRPYIMRDDLGTVVKDRVAAPRVNAALVGACSGCSLFTRHAHGYAVR